MGEPKSESASKPQVTLTKPARPGSGLMWAGLTVTALSIAITLTYNNYPSTQMEPTVEVANVIAHAASKGVESVTQAGVADPAVMVQSVAASTTAIAAADAAARVGVTQAPSSTDSQTMNLNGVAITFATDASWQVTRSGRQVMLLNPAANVICQLTARNDATPGAIKHDAAGDEAGLEASYVASMLPIPGATQAATLLFRDEANGEYRYGVRIRVDLPTQARSAPLEFVNALAERATHMARIQCAHRNIQVGADLTPASALASSLHVH